MTLLTLMRGAACVRIWYGKRPKMPSPVAIFLKKVLAHTFRESFRALLCGEHASALQQLDGLAHLLFEVKDLWMGGGLGS